MLRILREDYSEAKLIVSGGARGANKLAEQCAATLGIPTKIFEPKWRELGKVAGFMRNKLIERAANECLAFASKKRDSKGTEHTIFLFEKAGKSCRVELF